MAACSLRVAVAFLVLPTTACTDGGRAKDSVGHVDSNNSALDTAPGDTSLEGDVDTDADSDADADTPFDSGEPLVNLPVDQGFEASLTEWVIKFDEWWGYFWQLSGTDATGDTVLAALQLPLYLEPDTTVVAEVEGEENPFFAVIDHRPGADCSMSCDGCLDYRGSTYRAIDGQIELSLWEDHADVRLTNLRFAAQFDGGETIVVPLIELTDVPYEICPDDH